MGHTKSELGIVEKQQDHSQVMHSPPSYLLYCQIDLEFNHPGLQPCGPTKVRQLPQRRPGDHRLQCYRALAPGQL